MIRHAEFRSRPTPDDGLAFSGPNADDSVGAFVSFGLDASTPTAWFAGYVESSLVAHELLDWSARERYVVASHGQAYLCRAGSGTITAEALDVQPATSLALTLDEQGVIIADFTNLHRFEPDGTRVWISDRVSYDGIRKLAVEHDHCTLEAWDAPGRRYVAVTVDLATGRATGSPHHTAR
jgi:hypothetical protein